MTDRLKIGQEVLIHGYIDEIRKDTIIIRNEGGYFGTVECEVSNADVSYTDQVLKRKTRIDLHQVVNILRTEKECVGRQDTTACPNRDCANCDLLLPTEEVLQAYTAAIDCIEGLLTESEERIWQ